ncbi:acetyl/propionyl/methylcrotonyl-CoA carboxylase subunit alpha [Xinfangfangia pollutisoli]|uniref:acetyl/propionyl/methylcrotonyl-CoA carboxylase subunit alpha n=1 Tax=Xinfangfangia pollutisoli TaxID=2865960 RepID=UPI001CD3E10A|nr:biotin carboxylase N-terminal domain-containing protein [Xinfangfangia pollutisoli]
MNEFLKASRPIRSVLVANRGEIACRIIAACHKLGLRAIAIYSEADADARHVSLADEAHLIGPAPSAQSYLNIEAVIAAARRSGADAIHPGYGFLSENAGFSAACAAAGIVFVGPSPEAVAAMGSKIEARRIAEAAGVPIVPGYEARNAGMADIAAAADRIGYPVMVKASAGGGGRGMREVADASQLQTAIQSARAEAGAAFGDDTVFIERLILAPRHLEVQVFGDGKGDALHFFERDCSIQRNHQKLVEEAPAPNLPDAIRSMLYENALKLARAISYAGAGTVEFIMQSGSDEVFFLEMNTRLQVEHPVTEAICGVDLVELQLRQAAGLPLGLTQDQIVARGHAIEVRLNAERPDAGFLPATGRFVDIVAPRGLRFDTGVMPGSTVGTHYDSMLAKLIAHGPDRESARLRLIEGLEMLAMPGVQTNQPFLADCLRAPVFAQGQATTGFLADHFPAGWAPDRGHVLKLRAGASLQAIAAPGTDPLRRSDGFRVTAASRPATIPLRVEDEAGTADLRIELSSPPRVVQAEESQPLTGMETARYWRQGDVIHGCWLGHTVAAKVRALSESSLDNQASGDHAGQIQAPLTGLVSAIHVQPQDMVRKGDPLVEMEAMKLVHSLVAPFDGRVTRLGCAVGETLTARSILVELEEAV